MCRPLLGLHFGPICKLHFHLVLYPLFIANVQDIGSIDTYGSPLPPEVLEHNPSIKYYPESSVRIYGSSHHQIQAQPVVHASPKPVHNHQQEHFSGRISHVVGASINDDTHLVGWKYKYLGQIIESHKCFYK